MDCIEDEIVFKWTNVCRLCLSSNVEIDIFETKTILEEVVAKFDTHLNFLVYSGDPMPRKLCSACWQQLEAWHSFRQKCIENEKNLKNRLKVYASLDFVKRYLTRDDEYHSTSAKSDTSLNPPAQLAEKSSEKSSPSKSADERPPSQGPADSTNIFLAGGAKIKVEPGVLEAPVETPVTVSLHSSVEERTVTSVNESGECQGILAGRIVSVVGNAADLWNNHNESIDCDGIKKEDGEKPEVYNLRPRTDPSLTYDVPDWMEDSQPSPIVPLRKKVTPWKCPECNVHFESRALLKEHNEGDDCLGKHVETFQCRMCPRKFLSESELAEHNLTHMTIAYDILTDDLFACQKCDMAFADPERLKEHSQTHSGRSIPKQAVQYPCIDCGLVFMKKASLDEHVATHQPKARPSRIVASKAEETRDLACSLCISRFSSEDLLYDHRFATHGIPDERVACNTCSVKFRGPDALKEHEAVAHTSRTVAKKSTKASVPQVENSINGRVRCLKCGRLFENREELERHEASKHKIANPFMCRKCSRRFPTRSLFLFHQRCHLGCVTLTEVPKVEKPPEVVEEPKNRLFCEACRVVFKHTGDLNAHLAAHQDFTGSTSRIRHLPRVLYRYQCSGCPQMFGSAASKTRHSTLCHLDEDFKFLRFRAGVKKISSPASSGKRYRCGICNVSASSLSLYHCHLKIKHGISNEDLPSSKISSPAVPLQPKQVASSPSHSPASSVTAAGEPQVNCRYCSKLYSASYIQRHLKLSHGIVTSTSAPSTKLLSNLLKKCRYCGITCSTSHNLKKHEEAHGKSRDEYQCKTCGRQFARRYKSNFVRHSSACRKKAAVASRAVAIPPRAPEYTLPRVLNTVSVSQVQPDGHTCSICLNSYETKNLLELHVMTAHRVVPMQEESIMNNEIWQEVRNMIVREVDGAYVCTLCCIRFENQEEAAWHRAQHPRGNQYIIFIEGNRLQCTACDAEFDRWEIALAHTDEHAQADIKPNIADLQRQAPALNCPFCPATFSNEETIRNHLDFVHPQGSINNP